MKIINILPPSRDERRVYVQDNIKSFFANDIWEDEHENFSESELVFEQQIRSCHIDMSHHMNNIEYIKFALSVFTDDFLQSHEISDLEVHYTGESKEGQILRVYRRDDADCEGKTFIHIKEDERCVFECCVKFI